MVRKKVLGRALPANLAVWFWDVEDERTNVVPTVDLYELVYDRANRVRETGRWKNVVPKSRAYLFFRNDGRLRQWRQRKWKG